MPTEAQYPMVLQVSAYLVCKGQILIWNDMATFQAEYPGYAAMAAQLCSEAHLESLHLDPATGTFADWGNHTQDVILSWRLRRGPNGEVIGREVVREITGQPPQPQYVPHFG